MNNINTRASTGAKTPRQQDEALSSINSLPGLLSTEFSSYVARLMTISQGVRSTRDELNTDGPATCLINF